MVNYGLVIIGCILMGSVLFILWHPSISNSNPLIPIYNDISFPTGDHIIFYTQQQASNIVNTIPGLKVLGTDTHGNYVVQNTTTNQVLNVSKSSPQANAILASQDSTTPSNTGTYLSFTGNSYGSQASSIRNPTTTQVCHNGQSCHISGKIVIADPGTCKMQTVNGVTKNVCVNLPGPFTYTFQILCSDPTSFRCSTVQSLGLPTTHGVTQPDGTFDYPWTPSGDSSYVGNYIGRMYAVSETPGVSGQKIDETGDFPLQIVQ